MNENWKTWKEFKLKVNTRAPNSPVDTGTELFGKKLSIPLLSGPIGSIKVKFNPDDDVRDYNNCCIAACHEAGVLACFGNGLFDGVVENAVKASKRHEGYGIPIFNPFSQTEIMQKMSISKSASPAAIGVVIDSAGLPHLKSRADAVM